MHHTPKGVADSINTLRCMNIASLAAYLVLGLLLGLLLQSLATWLLG
jgi:hypothetical protein